MRTRRIPHALGWHGLSWALLGVKGIWGRLLRKSRDFTLKTRPSGDLAQVFDAIPSWFVLSLFSQPNGEGMSQMEVPRNSNVLAAPKRQTVCKPGSVQAAQHSLGRPFLWDARRRAPHATNPGDGAGTPSRHTAPLLSRAAGHPYSVLLPVGFTLPAPLPERRCALTAPFHPCLRAFARRRFVFCGTVPGVAPAGR